MIGTSTLVVIVALLTVACGVPIEKSNQKGSIPADPRYYQRFLPLPESAPLYGVPRPFLALDTVTGQLCRTADLTWLGKETAAISGLPLCVNLYISSGQR